MNNITSLGFEDWCHFVGYAGFDNDYLVMRVTAVNRNSCMISDGVNTMQAELSGKFVYDSGNPEDFPATGDWVEAEVFDNYSFGIIHNVLPRKTLLKRKVAGKKIDFQLIAANIDVGLLVQAADNINLNLFERYLVMLGDSRIDPLVVVTKIDLLENSDIETLKNRLRRLNSPSIFINNLAPESLDDSINKLLIPEKTYCLLGPSGVGKSTMLNNLLEREVQRTSSVRSGDGKGRHTTVSRQLLKLDSGAIFIDTPGMRELANIDVNSSIDNTFSEFGEYALSCRFADCTHTHEKGCAVKEAVDNGEIEQERYDNYLKLKKESEYYGMEYHDRLKKDKKFGKMQKNYKKNHKKF